MLAALVFLGLSVSTRLVHVGDINDRCMNPSITGRDR